TYILLGCATGNGEALDALHSTRLDMLLSKILDSTVRGIVYEAAGSVDADVLAGGAARVRAFSQDSRVPYVLLGHDPRDHEGWLNDALAAVDQVLGAPA
ncbi:MAG: hypothetical protein QOG59_2913, partial [Solirubrobacteraceae bacterium]|nr:hypothetical protein [Solirubrobacteraceae bacterium]